MQQLAPYQTKCVADLKKLFAKERAVCLAWYTGAGKTDVFISYIKFLLRENPKTKIGISSYLTTEIKDQIYGRLVANGLGEKTHKIEPGIPKLWTKNITAFNPQGIYRSLPENFKFDFLILDEAHAGISHDKTMINKIKNKILKDNGQILLVSATPWDALQRKEFQGIRVLKRPLSDGIKDGRISDFRIFKEQAEIEFSPDDFTRVGDLNKNAAKRRIAVLKAACIGKVKNIIAKHDLGEKTIVICPPGNSGEIALELAKEFGGLAFLQSHIGAGSSHEQVFSSTEGNLEKFKTDSKVKFLFVIYKCQVGFDMPELASVIDLSMTRNIKVLVQRLGRVARLSKGRQKKYFYVYDKSLGDEKIDWLLYTVIDFCLGAFDGMKTNTTKYRETRVHGYVGHKDSFLLTEIINQLAKKESVTTARVLRFDFGRRPAKYRTLAEAIEEAKKYKDRHDLFKKDPALYKFFRVEGHIEKLNEIHPYLMRMRYWTEERVIEALKQCTSRSQLRIKFPGAESHCRLRKRKDLLDKYLPSKQDPTKIWTHERILAEVLPKLMRWNDLRKYAGVRSRIVKRLGGMTKYRKIWEKDFKPKVRK